MQSKLVIKEVRLMPMKGRKKHKDDPDEFRNVAFFSDAKYKPMILNAGNSKIVRGFAKSRYIEDWNNIAVEIYAKDNVRFGREITEGLRVNPNQPKIISEKDILSAIKTLESNKGRVSEVWKSLPPELRNHPKVLSKAKSLK